MNYNKLNDMARNFLRGDSVLKNSSDILVILESLDLSDFEDRKKIETAKILIRELERGYTRLKENNDDLKRILEANGN